MKTSKLAVYSQFLLILLFALRALSLFVDFPICVLKKHHRFFISSDFAIFSEFHTMSCVINLNLLSRSCLLFRRILLPHSSWLFPPHIFNFLTLLLIFRRWFFLAICSRSKLITPSSVAAGRYKMDSANTLNFDEKWPLKTSGAASGQLELFVMCLFTSALLFLSQSWYF